jgi:hypothetical protein
MNETQSWLGTTGTTVGYSGTIGMGCANPNSILTVSHPNSGLTLQGNSTINYSNNSGLSTAITNTKIMAPKQVNVAVFTITRDVDTNEINSTKFLKELWVEQKNGTSIDLIVAKQLGNDFDPELTIIKVLSTVSF